jgi:hypothetical protein
MDTGCTNIHDNYGDYKIGGGSYKIVKIEVFGKDLLRKPKTIKAEVLRREVNVHLIPKFQVHNHKNT